jgi:2-keto-4-pentenoate hydratase/2-oxohepta-3-ene-1,7-dioic acid hydratase in catechol pathway
MKFIRYKTKTNDTKYGVLEEGNLITEITNTPFESFTNTDITHLIDDVSILSPVTPSKIICVGLNYLSHIKEMGLAIPKSPMLFMKPITTLTDPNTPIIYPKIGQKVEYEAELTVVIGKPTRHVSESDALDYVLGYTCGNDVSERVFQMQEMKSGAMLIGKGFDSFCPLGPVIETTLDPDNVAVKARLNGKEKQNGNTSDLLFSASKLISYISAAMTLMPGDVILTGTPSGVGPIAHGDTVEIEIPEIGILKNNVTNEQ